MDYLVFNPFSFFYNMIFNLADLFEVLNGFMFSEYVVGDWTVSVWSLIGGGGLVVLIIAKLIKKLVLFV